MKATHGHLNHVLRNIPFPNSMEKEAKISNKNRAQLPVKMQRKFQPACTFLVNFLGSCRLMDS